MQKELDEQKKRMEEMLCDKDGEIHEMQKLASMKSIEVQQLTTRLEQSKQNQANNDLGQFFNDVGENMFQSADKGVSNL